MRVNEKTKNKICSLYALIKNDSVFIVFHCNFNIFIFKLFINLEIYILYTFKQIIPNKKCPNNVEFVKDK